MRDNKTNRVDEFFSQFAATKDRSRRFQIAVCVLLLAAVLQHLLPQSRPERQENMNTPEIHELIYPPYAKYLGGAK